MHVKHALFSTSGWVSFVIHYLYLLPSVAKQLPILDVTWRCCFFVPSPRPSYIGETVLNPCHSIHSLVGCKDFSEIVVSSSIRRLFVFVPFWFDFIYFILRSHDSSQDFSLIRAYLHAVCWILTMQRIDNILNISGKDSLFLSGDIHEGICYLDLLYSVRYSPYKNFT
jgi:hypothetical protein